MGIRGCCREAGHLGWKSDVPQKNWDRWQPCGIYPTYFNMCSLLFTKSCVPCRQLNFCFLSRCLGSRCCYWGSELYPIKMYVSKGSWPSPTPLHRSPCSCASSSVTIGAATFSGNLEAWKSGNYKMVM